MLSLLLFVFAEFLARVAICVVGRDSRFDFTLIHERHREMQEMLKELLDSQGDALVALDDILGWTYRANYRGELYSSNSQGLRGQREYPAVKPGGGLRIAAFGDSFIHANEMVDVDAWSARLEALNGRIEVLNFGVGGYGTDQAFLLYDRRKREFDADVVLLGFAEVNYARNVNRFRRFLSVHTLPLSKPRFKLNEAGDLAVIPNPFPRREDLAMLRDDPIKVLAAAPNDWFFQPLEWRNPLYDHLAVVRLASTVFARAWQSLLRPDGLYRSGLMNTHSEAFQLLVALVERFAEDVTASGREFVFMIFPGRDSDIWGGGVRTYQPLLDRLGDLTVLDLADPLRRAPEIGPANLHRFAHYSAEANDVVARSVGDFVIEQGWLERE